MQRAIRGTRTRRFGVAIAGLGLVVAAAAACTPVVAVGKGAGGTSTTTSPAPTPTPTPTPTAPPTTVNVPAYPGTYLQIGSTGAAVTAVQQKLNVSPVTGYFGTITQAAVMTFQRTNSLEVDGQVGPQTWAKIFNVPVPVTTPTPTPTSTTKAPTYPKINRPAGLGAQALALIKQEAGKPYLYGAAGPNSFDCSGLTMYVYNKLGVQLMRSANDQYRTTLHVPYAQAQPGDLIFFYDTTGYVYHVGMYAGNGMMWDAPHTGAVVRYENVWYPDQVWVGVPGATLAS
jgi:cell wall-associated NlpC family hydrolase